jgi:hypothetical protein
LRPVARSVNINSDKKASTPKEGENIGQQVLVGLHASQTG